MADSTAELLFKINADPEAAKENIARFRGVLSRDLDGMRQEFAHWSEEVFGSLDSGKALAIAGFAGLAAAGVAAFGILEESAQKYIEVATEVGRAKKLTGLGAEDLSVLRAAAKETGTDFESLTTGIVRFERTIDAANNGNEKAISSLARVGLSGKALKDAHTDLFGALMKVGGALASEGDQTAKVGVVMDIFGRQGVQGVAAVLKLTATQAEELRKRLQALGLLMSDEDVKKAKEYKLAMLEIKEAIEGLWVSLGRHVIPSLVEFIALAEAVYKHLGDLGREAGRYLEIASAVASGNVAKAASLIAQQSAQSKGFGKVWNDILVETADHLGDLEKRAAAAAAAGDGVGVKPEKVKQLKESFTGLVSMLDGINEHMAKFGSDDDRVAAMVNKLAHELTNQVAVLQKLHNEHKIDVDVYERQVFLIDKVRTAIGLLGDKETEALGAKRNAEMMKYSEALIAAQHDLEGRLLAIADDTTAHKIAMTNRELDSVRERLLKEYHLTRDNSNLIEEIRRASIAKINRDQAAAFDQMIARLDSERETIVASRQTTEERLKASYDREALKFSQTEERKAALQAADETEAWMIHVRYAGLRKAIDDQYGSQLLQLRNSKGWQGVFGSEFAQMIRQNEALTREWASSTNQSLMMVRVAMQSLREMSQQTFGQFSQAMGQNIAQAIVFKGSIADAMRSALASTLESLAAQAFVQAIFATGLGFMRIAQYDYAGAAAAFEAAGLFALVGSGAAMAGRFIAPSQSSGASSSAAGASSTAAASGSGSGASTASGAAAPGPRVTININGHVFGTSGMQEVAGILSDAVQNLDVKLVASHTRAMLPA